ncbi:MAG: class I SAM-dependent DNA methyltransferase [Gammaproteobacteria bacterium]|nr:class I SAM-dependent DNA methyltransferase [Gammaproteobacteria bacterium]
MFQILDTPESDRQKTLDEDLARFPYVNGDLFDGVLRIPSFDGVMREALLDACRFDWSNISPAIFGALFQSVMDPEARHADGAHYTTEGNILKVIEPLFLDDLRSEFKRLKSRKDRRRHPELLKFQKKLGEMRFFDPACGCGNFLIIAYRELRILEIEVMKEIYPSGQLDALAGDLSVIDVDQFYGIEINEFPVRVAETALWMMDHIMNNRLSLEFGQTYVRIPLKKSPHIHHGDALEADWAEFCPPQQCSHVFGNPPYLGAKVQTPEQRMQVRHIAALGGTGGSLDYVSAWFIKAGEYVQKSFARIGFVATNSITQGEQVGQLWPILFDRCKLEIAFAHQTFAWGSDAKGKAHVHVVIIGLDRRKNSRTSMRLFNYPDIKGQPEETQHATLSPYLFDASRLTNPHLVVQKESRPINNMKKLVIGSKPIDGGHYIFNAKERADFLKVEPDAKPFLHPFVGAREFLQGGGRWILSLQNVAPNKLAKLPKVRECIAAVRAYRLKRKSGPTLSLADTPTLYHVNILPTAPFLVVPKVSSERREYVPIGWLEPPTIPSDLVFVLQNATLVDFALLTSAMHMAWLRHIGGRLESRYRYSIGLVYNTFPTPPAFKKQSASLTNLGPLAQAILDARAEHPDATLANLYDPDLMPLNLRKAHQALDRSVDRLYSRTKFLSERERIEHLFMLYEKIRAPNQIKMN